MATTLTKTNDGGVLIERQPWFGTTWRADFRRHEAANWLWANTDWTTTIIDEVLEDLFNESVAAVVLLAV